MRRLGAHTAAVDAVTMSIDPRWAASIGGHEAKRWDLEQYCEANIWPSGTRGPLPEIPPQDSTIVRSAPSGRPQARLSCSVWVGFCRVYQYAIIRPAVVAASQAARDKPPKTRSFRCSEFDVEERIADVFRRLGNQQANAGGGRDAKAGGRDGNDFQKGGVGLESGAAGRNPKPVAQFRPKAMPRHVDAASPAASVAPGEPRARPFHEDGRSQSVECPSSTAATRAMR